MEENQGRVQAPSGVSETTEAVQVVEKKDNDLVLVETDEERKQREERAERQVKEIGYASLKNRKSPMEIFKAMEKSEGIQANVCVLLDCSVREFRQLLTQSKLWATTWAEIRSKLVSKAECVMVDLLESKQDQLKFSAAKYILDKLGGNDGYGQTTTGFELTVQGADEQKAMQIKAIFGISE